MCLFGQSLGAAVAIVLAAEDDGPLAGLCFEGPFASYRSAARFLLKQTWMFGVAGLASRLLISDGFSAIEYAAQLPRIPKLFICGSADRVVDHADTIALHARATAPKELWVIDGNGHTEAVIEKDSPGRERVIAFFNDCASGSYDCPTDSGRVSSPDANLPTTSG